MERSLGKFLRAVGACCWILSVACSGGASSDAPDASGQVQDSGTDDGSVPDASDGSTLCAAGSSQCTDTGGYQVCGDDGLGGRNFGPRLPCQGVNTCSAGSCGSTCVTPEVLVLLDRSSSIADKWDWVTDELNTFTGAEEGFIKFGLRQFPSATDACSASSIVPIALNNSATVAAALVDPTVDAQTPIVAALTDTASAFGDPNEAQYIIVITDGDETCSAESLPLLVEQLARQGIDTFVVGIGNGANPVTVNSIAAAGRTGPTGYSVSSSGQFAVALQDIAQRMNSCVCTPSSTACAGRDFQTCASDGFSLAIETCSDDGIECTNDSCDATQGCNWADDSLSCSDIDGCTGNDSCSSGACAGDPIVCNTPDDPECFDAATRRVYQTAGTCSADICSYPFDDEACAGATCSAGVLTCPDPPAPECLSTTSIRTYQPGGVCPGSGDCDYNFLDTSISCDTPPAPECASNTVLRTFASQGTCVGAGCEHTPSETSCTVGCSEGECGPWLATSLVGAPAPRLEHSAAWTGSEMLIWGGGSTEPRAGGRFSPGTDSWSGMATVNAPSARDDHSTVWTGSEMIIWGGLVDSFIIPLQTGGRYSPAADSWATTSLTGAPLERSLHTAVWTGTEMIIWGGNTSSPDGGQSGGRYDPATDLWIATSLVGAPTARTGHTAVWTGSEMIVWGGGVGASFNGGRYNPATNSWQAMADAP